MAAARRMIDAAMFAEGPAMTGPTPKPHRFGAYLLTVLLACPGLARADTGQHAAEFDRPLAVQTVDPRSESDPDGRLRCTYYADLAIREAGTDTPAPLAAAMFALPGKSPRPACASLKTAAGTALPSADFYLLGRRGPFLVFEASDPNGASPFLVFDVPSGHTLLRDGSTGSGIHSARLEQGALHLRFTRGINADCSLPRDGAACWNRLLEQGKIGQDIYRRPPPVQACLTTYRRDKAPNDDPSVVTYEVDLLLDRAGTVSYRLQGPLGCEPMP